MFPLRAARAAGLGGRPGQVELQSGLIFMLPQQNAEGDPFRKMLQLAGLPALAGRALCAHHLYTSGEEPNAWESRSAGGRLDLAALRRQRSGLHLFWRLRAPGIADSPLGPMLRAAASRRC